MIEKLVKDLLIELEIEDEEVRRHNGAHTVELFEGITITFNDLKPAGLSMVSPLTECAESDTEELLTMVMMGNLFGEQTGGAVIGIDEEEKNFILSLEIPFEVSYQGFYSEIENFINNVEFWQNQILNHRKSSANKEL
jgi:hypothetical protein